MESNFVMKDKMPTDECNKDVTHVEFVNTLYLTYKDIILMTFLSKQQDYQFFNKYAKYQGFSIKIDKALYDLKINTII